MVACYRFPKLPGAKGDDEKADLVEDDKSVPRPADGEDWLFDDAEPPGDSGAVDEGEEKEAEDLPKG